MRSDEDEKNNSGKVAMVYKYFAWHYAIDYEQKNKQPDQNDTVEKMYSRLGGKQNLPKGCIGGTGSADGRYAQSIGETI